MSRFALILPAAGRSTRFGGTLSKVLTPLAGEPVLSRSIRPFLAHPDFAVAVIASSEPEAIKRAIASLPPARIKHCAGGDSRAQSVLNALRCVPAEVEWVAVHDAARPLISSELITQTLAAAAEQGAAVPALPVTLTIKQAIGPLPATVQRTLPRHTLWAMQTPQVMRRLDLLNAYAQYSEPLEHITDDAQLLELAGYPVWLIPGDDLNLKLTTAGDLAVAERLLETLA